MNLALDLGSTHLKAGVFDDHLNLLGTGKQPVSYERNAQAGTVEFAANEFLDGMRGCMGEALRTAKTEGRDILHLAITSQAQTFGITDRENKPRQSFISWMDRRAERTCAEMSGKYPWQECGQHVSFNEMIPPLTSCVLQHQQDRGTKVDQQDRIHFLSSFLGSALGAEAVVDRNLAAMSGLYSLQQHDWWGQALEALGVVRENLPRLCDTGEACTQTGPEAHAFGLPADIPVIMAGNDQTAGAFGAELDRQGLPLVTLGTAHVVYLHQPELPEPAPGLARGPYPGKGFYRMAADGRGGNVVDWATQALLADKDRQAFFEAAAQSPPGAHGLAFSASLDGTGKWSRKKDGENTPDLARSVLEDLADILGQMIDTLCPGYRGTMLVAGGGSIQPVWLEILEQQTGLKMKPTTADPLRGAARMASETR